MTDALPSTDRGSAVGYTIRSNLSFASLRAGGGTPLEVLENDGLGPAGTTLITWHARADNPFEGTLLQDGERFRFWANDAGWYLIEPALRTITLAPGADPLRRELRMFGIPVALCSTADGDVSIHAAAVDVHGAGILLAGPGRYGKTTLAAGFARAGHRLLTEDTTRCRPDPPAVFPGPAVLRLREDVGRRLAIAGTSLAGSLDAGRVPLIFDGARRGTSAAVPLRAIVIVREPADALRLEPARASDAARDLLALTFRLPTRAAMADTFSRLAQLTAAVPAFNLHRPMTLEALDAVVTHVADELAGKA